MATAPTTLEERTAIMRGKYAVELVAQAAAIAAALPPDHPLLTAKDGGPEKIMALAATLVSGRIARGRI